MITIALALLEFQAHPGPEAGGVPTTELYSVIGGLVSALAAVFGWSKHRENVLGKVIGAKDMVIAEKDVKIAALIDRIDELQEERVQFAQSMLADLKAARDALKGGQGDGSS